MRESVLGVFLTMVISLAGCIPPQPPDNHQEGEAAKQSLIDYRECLDHHLNPLLSSPEDPGYIADAVVASCEVELLDARKTYSNYLRASVPAGRQLNIALSTEPDKQMADLREHGRRRVIAKIINYRSR